jgi:hypothetical protein
MTSNKNKNKNKNYLPFLIFFILFDFIIGLSFPLGKVLNSNMNNSIGNDTEYTEYNDPHHYDHDEHKIIKMQNEMILNLKNQIKDLKQKSSEEPSKFELEKPLQFNSTYNLSQSNKNKLPEVKLNTFSPQFESLFNINNCWVLISLIISFILSILQFIFSDRIINLLSTKIDEAILNESTLDEVLSYHKVKYYLFIDDECYFKQKHGQNFHIDNYDIILIKNELLDIINNCSLGILSNNSKEKFTPQAIEVADNLKKLVHETKQYEYEMRISVIVYLIQIVTVIICVISLCLVLNVIRLDYGCVRIITIVIVFLFIGLVMAILILKKEKKK